MPTLETIQTAAKLSKLLGRVTAALEQAASDVFKNAQDGNDANLPWMKRAWWTVGANPPLQWYAQRALEHAVHQSSVMQAAIDANPDDPQVTDAQITAFVQSFVAKCEALNI